jgi:hypothetical protein
MARPGPSVKDAYVRTWPYPPLHTAVIRLSETGRVTVNLAVMPGSRGSTVTGGCIILASSVVWRHHHGNPLRVGSRPEGSMGRSYVVTGGGRGIGRAIVERLLSDGEDNAVVAIDLDAGVLSWVDEHPTVPRAISVVGDASEEAVAEKAADLA